MPDSPPANRLGTSSKGFQSSKPALAPEAWEALLSSASGRVSDGAGDSLDTLHQRARSIQRRVRKHFHRRRLQRTVVQQIVVRRRRERNLTDEHVVDERFLGVSEIASMTLDSASSAFNAVTPVKKGGVMRTLGGQVQLLMAALEGIGRLGGMSDVPSFVHAAYVLLSDVFSASAVYFGRVVIGVGPLAGGIGRALEVGSSCPVPLHVMPLAVRAVTAARERGISMPHDHGGGEHRSGELKSLPPISAFVDAKELSDLRVVSWLEAGAARTLGRPEMLVSAGDHKNALCAALSDAHREEVKSRKATSEDACYMTAVVAGDAVIVLSRSELGHGAMTADELAVPRPTGSHILPARSAAPVPAPSPRYSPRLTHRAHSLSTLSVHLFPLTLHAIRAPPPTHSPHHPCTSSHSLSTPSVHLLPLTLHTTRAPPPTPSPRHSCTSSH
jgi:hypothetical protein